jgi:anti-anti-sigma factor
MTVTKADRTGAGCPPAVIVQLDRTLRVPVSSGLRRTVAALLSHGEQRLVLDLERLDALDAAGVGELLAAYRSANAAGGILRIIRPGRRVRRLLDVAGVLGVLRGTRGVDVDGRPRGPSLQPQTGEQSGSAA